MSITAPPLTHVSVPAKTEKDVEVVIQSDGSVVMIHDDDLFRLLSGVFVLDTRRAAHVEPTASGRWGVDVGPVTGRADQTVGVFERRDEALSAERAWLTDFLRESHVNAETGRLEVPLLQQ